MFLDIFYVIFMQIFCSIVSFIFLVYTPEPNGVIGYKTKKSSRDRNTWRFANKLVSKIMLFMSLLSLMIGIILLVLKHSIGLNIELLFWFYLPSMFLMLIVPVVSTEIALAFRFKKEVKNKAIQPKEKSDNEENE